MPSLVRLKPGLGFFELLIDRLPIQLRAMLSLTQKGRHSPQSQQALQDLRACFAHCGVDVSSVSDQALLAMEADFEAASSKATFSNRQAAQLREQLDLPRL
jgi:hypothetical protein